jgi:hypothetical protein
MIDIPEPLRDSTTQLHEARQSGDGQAIAALYSEDALLILPSGQRLAGRTAIADYYRNAAARPAAGGRRSAGASEPGYKFYFFPPLVHAVATVNGRHGEKHSLVDIYQQQADLQYLLVFSSWTLR